MSRVLRPLPVLSEDDKERFWAKVDVRGPDECWEWKGYVGLSRNKHVFSKGYGQVYLRGGRKDSPHRIAFLLANPSVTNPNFFACHRCDNPPCCNPSHLYLGSPDSNMKDKAAKGRCLTGGCHPARRNPSYLKRGDDHYSRISPEVLARGSKNGNSALNEDKVANIRKDYATGLVSQHDLAVCYAVGTSTINRVVLNRIWKHVATPTACG